MWYGKLRALRLLALLGAFCFVAGASLPGLTLVNRYSPLNKERSPRQATEYIILHTTEGPGKGSLDKLRKYGEAHYLVDTDGTVYRIIDRKRIAMHAGRSMWQGRANLDAVSVGIEIVGYHDRPITAAQKTALKELLRQLQSVYKLPDSRVLPHSMVAYGRPNRWHPKPHRGRKRCAMYLGRESLRAEIGLHEKPSFDPDVRAGRLVVADAALERVLYGPDPAASKSRTSSVAVDTNDSAVIRAGRSAWDIAREQYNAAGTIYRFPDGTTRKGSEIRDWGSLPAGTRVTIANRDSEREGGSDRVQEIGKDGKNAWEIAAGAYNDADTIYFLLDGRVRKGNELSRDNLDTLPAGTRMLVGYLDGGFLSRARSAYDAVGPRWNLATTFYRFPDGAIVSGSEIDESKLPNRTMVFVPR
ncbi:N-acetylmuramoyl-L-alanine amidase [Pelagicoccus sp. SDUM812005]|uniref:N-acetylmuramoyl-L-alanine amidase n=1 Tax=Pelagicoccus sp. SDUM812005 TaxID=3041257 RepID=UPI00280CA34F|nr:N-acetylmuramoyl-L-alanine amidase [Pelagicoccus sp. SDUM812005]MDQ8183420.1 N-acetylmuramoyl-L-alanine amidase [Pelagicoccus sp. SDUM812005]